MKFIPLYMIASLAAAFAFFASPAHAADKDPVYTGFSSNVAVGGYDTVSFFDGGAAKGSKEFETEYNGAVWRFTTAENRDRFLENPGAYAPQYGGYCAWAVAQGYTAKGDPRYASIVAGKLYLNFNADVQEKWNRDIPGFIAKADENWPGVLER